MAFSDEAYFTLDGEVNSQNIRCYAPHGAGPENFTVTTNKYPQKYMVFLGILSLGKTFTLKFYKGKEDIEINVLAFIKNFELPIGY